MFLYAFVFSIFSHLATFHKMCYKNYATREQPKTAILNFLEKRIKLAQAHNF